MDYKSILISASGCPAEHPEELDYFHPRRGSHSLQRALLGP
ncbi:MAG: hypothetical protein AAGC64_12975 [Bacteroidota bacterium]